MRGATRLTIQYTGATRRSGREGRTRGAGLAAGGVAIRLGLGARAARLIRHLLDLLRTENDRKIGLYL